LIYLFKINCNKINGYPGGEKLSIDPSILVRYKALDLTLFDSTPISYPPIEDGYASCEWGDCRKVGQFLIHYFFEGEEPGYFSPAMLFIFDTRTNEARWLRVGWR